MKKLLFVLSTLIVAATMAHAVPADPRPFKYTQPDGSVIILRNHGDEYFNWRTNEQGQIVEKGADGFYRPVAMSLMAYRSIHAYHRPARAQWSSYENHPSTNFGDVKILCLIANFTDSTFVVENPRQHFDDMLNKEGYDENGSIGSVRDYYIDNSCGQYRPHFDVYGPINLSQSSSYYSNNNVRPFKVGEAVIEALELLGNQIDLADYDNDDDGDVDMILFYYPGHNPAEGAGVEGIWPHQSTGYFGEVQGKTINRYFCTSELKNVTGADPASIGTTCHEFAHSLGLPDFYDTDYEANGLSAYNVDFLDVMAGGSYNDNGRRPPYLTSIERNMLGWSPAPAKIEAAGDYSIEAVRFADANANRALRIDARNEGEYFILESRDHDKWDSGFNCRGMVVYHIDKSSRIVAAGMSAEYLWNSTNQINAYGVHPCFYSLKSGSGRYYSDYVYPGHDSITQLDLTDWDDLPSVASISNIAYADGKSVFSATLNDKEVFGYVRDKKGNPVEGVQIVLSRSAYDFVAVPALRPGDRTCLTDEYGYYSFVLDDNASEYQIVTARMQGFVSVSKNVLTGARFARQNFVLYAPGDGGYATLKKYNDYDPLYTVGGLNRETVAVGFCYTAEEIADMKAAGAGIDEITILSAAQDTDFDKAYLIVDFGDERVLKLDITDEYAADDLISFDLTSYNLVMPEGKDVYFGYGFTGLDPAHYADIFYIAGPLDQRNGGNYYCSDFLNSNAWNRATFGGQVYDFVLSANLGLKVDIGFHTHGVSSISLTDGVPTVNVAAGKTLMSATWYLDGELVQGEPVSVNDLPAGPHTYMVRLQYYDGTAERVYYDVN